MQEKFYYIVGVSLLILLVLVVYVGNRVQNLEMAIMNVDSRLAAIEQAFGASSSTSYDANFSNNNYNASVYDSFDTAQSGYDYYDYTY